MLNITLIIIDKRDNKELDNKSNYFVYFQSKKAEKQLNLYLLAPNYHLFP